VRLAAWGLAGCFKAVVRCVEGWGSPLESGLERIARGSLTGRKRPAYDPAAPDKARERACEQDVGVYADAAGQRPAPLQTETLLEAGFLNGAARGVLP
jgi:hypothetical protein